MLQESPNVFEWIGKLWNAKQSKLINSVVGNHFTRNTKNSMKSNVNININFIIK